MELPIPLHLGRTALSPAEKDMLEAIQRFLAESGLNGQTVPPQRARSIIAWIGGYKTYFMAGLIVLYGAGIDYHWWPHSLTLDSLLGGGTLAALRSAWKTSTAQIVNSNVNPASPAAQATAAEVPEVPKA